MGVNRPVPYRKERPLKKQGIPMPNAKTLFGASQKLGVVSLVFLATELKGDVKDSDMRFAHRSIWETHQISVQMIQF